MCDQKGEFNGEIDSDSIYLSNEAMSGEDASEAVSMATEIDNEVDRAVENIKYDFPSYCGVIDGDKSQCDTKNINSLEEELYDGNIAEIYLGNGIGSAERLKSSEKSDSNLSEMTNSFGAMDENDAEFKTNNFSPVTNGDQVSDRNSDVISEAENIPGLLNSSNLALETRKRPLSPNDYANNSSENKRVKSESMAYVDDVVEKNGIRSTHDEDVIDLCPPVAVVAPLGFCEDILDDASAEGKNLKNDTDDVKNDISSILDSFDDDDGKSLSMFDSVFEKMKTDIIAGQSFKTLDDGKWTFDDKSLNGSGEKVRDVTIVDNNDNKNAKQSVLRTEKEVYSKTEFKRANSVEHDIEDFEKVLSSVIANASKCSKGNENIVQKFSNTQPTSGMKASVHTKQCKQPCNHVANSDLLRELLDQKTDINDIQTKSRQEIDLSFLHSDLISGRGLSVSSDKILQTRSIDPRMTSIPHVDRGSTKNGQDSKGPSLQTSTKLQEGDHISLAEQRRASVTLHHKVPSNVMHLNHHSNMIHDVNGDSSNIIKEAFDFATEISDLKKNESVSTLSKPTNSVPSDPRQHVLASASLNQNMQNETYLNRNNYNQSLKIDPMQNNQMLRTSRMQSEMQPGSGLLTFANQGGAQTPDSSLPPQLAGPFMNSSENATARIHDIRQQQDPNQRQTFYSKRVDNMSSLGNRPNSGNGEMQPFKSQFEPTQINKMMYENSMQQFPTSQMDHLRNQKQTQPYANQNIPVGYPNQGHANQVLRNNTPDLGLQSQEKVPNFRQDPGMPMHYMNRAGMMPAENNYSMGMQERIRAMNVQQWYRRRMEAQMNKQLPQQSMMMTPQMSQGQSMGMHPNSHGVRMRQRHMYQGTEPGSQMMHPDQNMEHRLRAMQAQAGVMNSTNVADNQRGQHFPHGQNQMNFNSQNLRQQTQFGQQINQQNKMADSEAFNSIYMSRSFQSNGMTGNTKVTSPIGELSQHFDIKRESFNAQSVQDMFPF